ncbi:uncharacterized protein LOC132726094 [Ruditapes philippinarum]|uniref:uncharacterized protein LOC132726094 n=1 Tax=Ruditapes philippinarum TaxID=129788 RepID=UPI00295B0052|nr:uncharacterized protein LOC132726094 [Ruditapes philippinarum]
MTTFKSQNFSTCFNFTDFSSRLNEPEAKLIIVDIANEVSTNQVVKPDIEDDQKRWLIVGICLHSVISPALRKYIPPVVSQLYNKLKQTDKIDTQTFAKHMKRYKPTNKELNYEAINNNSAIPKVKGKKDEQKYNYNVTSDVDLTKLFLATNMAHYTGFDDTCDSSALLGIIVNIDSFQTLPKQTAEKVRSDIRNPWAHCNFSEWDVIKYQNSFQLMNQFIRNLLLPVQDETAILGQLLQWQTNGLQFLQGTTLGVELIQELKKETRALCKYILDIVLKNDTSFQDVHRSLLSIEGSLNKTSERIDNIETESLQLKTNLQSLTDTVTGLQDSQKENFESVESVKTEISDIQSCMGHSRSEIAKSSNKVTQLESRLDNLSLDVYGNESDLNDMQSEIIYARTEINHTNANVNSVKNALKETQEALQKSTLNLQSTKADCAKNTADIANINKYLSYVRPSGKVFFYPPDRISTFVSREEQLEQLRDRFNIHSSDTHTQVICGLGGIGKTTLAVEYAWTFQTFYPGGVFWMSAETNEALEDSVQRLAIDINILGNNTKETLVKTLKWLSCVQESWLLVIDNVDMDEIQGSVNEILSHWKRGSKGHIIITSRREAEDAKETFNVRVEDCISLDILNRNESVKFMMIRSCHSGKIDESLIELADELGGLPLALEQAAAYIKAIHCSFDEYLKKFNRKRLGVLKAIRPQHEVSKERLAVRTTWQLNFEYIQKQSEEHGLGNSAITVMEIVAFLYADDIPMILLNVGSPNVLDEELLDTFEEELGIKQVAEILSRFSLFNRCSTNSMSVHRLVQEVIRQNIKDAERNAFILQCASRMVNMALENTQSPTDALQEENIGRASLQMWSKLALNANTLKTYMFDYTKRNETLKDICFNIETTRILQTSAIYHSLYQRQDEALACQEQMLSIIPALTMSERDYNYLTRIKIPLLQNDRLILQSSITMAIAAESVASSDPSQDQTIALLDTESLHKMGNDAFKEARYQVAIQCYSEAITASNGNIDIAKYLTNRSLAYFKICDYENALRDADKCIQIDPKSYKAYCWKAYAIGNLIRLELLPKSWESAGLAAAAVAGHLNKHCLLEYRMKIEYPVVRYKIITNKSELGNEISSMMNRTYTTLLLRRGRYQIALDKGEITTKSVQVIGVEDGVEIESAMGIALINPKKYLPDIKIEQEIKIYFENVSFTNETGQILVSANVNAIFYRCRFSNGKKGCEDFPSCDGKNGCVNSNPDECNYLFSEQRKTSFPKSSGITGFPGISVCQNGNTLLDNCVLDRCGGGGTLSIRGAVLKIKNSVIRNMRQMGIEAREGGITFAENCTICDNQFHGVAIGPKGKGHVKSCIIQNNKREGIWCGGNLEPKKNSSLKIISKSGGGSTCEILNNLIYQNGMSGISLDGGSYDVSGNRIFDNWLWGMMIKSRSTTHICNNDIFENKCGGIRIGVNYSAVVVLDGNSIRDHTGPAIHTEEIASDVDTFMRSQHSSDNHETMKDIGMLDDEIIFYSNLPIITTRNVFEKNNSGKQHPNKISVLLETCCFCHVNSKHLKYCGKCKKASYCSKECQEQHWKRHKGVCKLIVEKYTIDIKMSDTEKWNEFLFDPGMIAFRGRNAPLPGLGEGLPPDKFSEKRFIVKIQSGHEYTPYNPNKDLRLYDQTQTLDIFFRSPEIYHLVCECGVLAASRLTTKKMFCWASFKSKGSVIRIYTDNLPPFQTW